MSKEIIVNDVNVAECRHLSFIEEDYCCDCQYEKYALCQNSDCYYKQLKRLQAENEGLKSTNDFVIKQLERRVNQLREYRKALEEIRDIVRKYDAEVGDTIIANPVQDCYDIFTKINEVLDERN